MRAKWYITPWGKGVEGVRIFEQAAKWSHHNQIMAKLLGASNLHQPAPSSVPIVYSWIRTSVCDWLNLAVGDPVATRLTVLLLTTPYTTLPT